MLITDSCHSSTDNVTLHLDGVLYYKVIDPYRVGHVRMYTSRKVIYIFIVTVQYHIIMSSLINLPSAYSTVY